MVHPASPSADVKNCDLDVHLPTPVIATVLRVLLFNFRLYMFTYCICITIMRRLKNPLTTFF